MAYHLGMSLVPPPVTLLNKSVGTRSGVAPGAPVGVLASWDVGAPRSDRQAVPEKRGTDLSGTTTRSETCAGLAEIPISSIATGREPVLFSTSDSDSLLVRPPSAREMSKKPSSYGGTLPGRSGVATGIPCGGCSRGAQGKALRRLPPRGICAAASDSMDSDLDPTANEVDRSAVG